MLILLIMAGLRLQTILATGKPRDASCYSIAATLGLIETPEQSFTNTHYLS